MRGKQMNSGKAILVLCIASFIAGTLFTSRTLWARSSSPSSSSSSTSQSNKDQHQTPLSNYVNKLKRDCDHKRKLVEGRPEDVMEEVKKTHQAIKSLENTVTNLEMELTAARTGRVSGEKQNRNQTNLQKAFVVIGINTAFSSRKRRDSLRNTWMPEGSHRFFVFKRAPERLSRGCPGPNWSRMVKGYAMSAVVLTWRNLNGPERVSTFSVRGLKMVHCRIAEYMDKEFFFLFCFWSMLLLNL